MQSRSLGVVKVDTLLKYMDSDKTNKFSMGTEQSKRLFSLYFRQNVQC